MCGREQLQIALRAGIRVGSVKHMGKPAAVAHLASLLSRWADSTGLVTLVSTLPRDCDGVACVLELSGGAKVCFDFLFTKGVETGVVDDWLIEDVRTAWIEGWLDDSEIWVSGRLDEYSILGRRGEETTTDDSDIH